VFISGEVFAFPVESNPNLVHDIRPMQTLNVGAGRSDQEYKAAEEQRLADLRSDVQTYAMYFFVAAGLAGLGTGLLPIRLFGFVNIGFIDLFKFYGGELVRANPLLLRVAAAAWVLTLIGLGVAGRKGQRWAFWAGLVLYAADMLPSSPCFHFGLLAFMVSSSSNGSRDNEPWENSRPPLPPAKTSAVQRLAISSNLQLWVNGIAAS
jgi:hypothetical protein